jgi:NAD(P)-dependent dehydrogenase (short-subunit alcohol dehydrogenase family)
VDDIPAQHGRTAVITGAGSGLGCVSARELARKGARVILAVRNLDKGHQARQGILRALPAAEVEVRHVDLADLDSVRGFAAGITEPVHMLVNNAAAIMPPRRALTVQGYELQFGTNHLGHFALTRLLLDRIGTDGRVVTVSSMTYRQGRLDFDDLDAARTYSPAGRYAASKLANVLFGLELDRRLREMGSSITSVVAHPGWARTNLAPPGATGVQATVTKVATLLFAQSAEAGASSLLHAATAPAVEGGQFIGPRRLMRGDPVAGRIAATARDPELAVRLWKLSEELTEGQGRGNARRARPGSG